MNIKLYPLLFTESKDPSRFTAPEYALVEWKDSQGTNLTLLHVESYKKFIQTVRDRGTAAAEKAIPIEKWICSYGGIETAHASDCVGAVETNYMVGSPDYPAAGSAMYALISAYFNKPITSDRMNSTSDKAKKAWARIEADSGNWQKVELDSYGTDYSPKEEKKYFDSTGQWPERYIPAPHIAEELALSIENLSNKLSL